MEGEQRRETAAGADADRPAEHDRLGSGLDSTDPRPVKPSINDLIEAYCEPGRRRYQDVLELFQASNKVEVREEYFAKFIYAGAVRTYDSRSGTHAIGLAYNSALAEPAFAETVRRLRREERESAVLLRGKSQDIIVQTIYGVIVYLLTVLDWVNQPGAVGPPAMSTSDQRVANAVKSAANELAPIRASLTAATRRTSLSEYAAGLPVGVVVATLAVTAVAFSGFRGGILSSSAMLATCLAAGALGGAVSVMTRISGGQGVFVASTHGRTMTVLAGAFRPLVGAVFGAVLYVLVIGGLLPLASPPAEQMDKVATFFAGLAFVAGFSERWAQDTIVQSIPKWQASQEDAPPARSGPQDAIRSGRG
jgi:hypothetical protein